MLGSRTDLHIFDAGSVNGTRYCNEILLPYVRLFRGAMGLQFLFMDDNAPCHRAEQLSESRRLAARTLPPVTIRELRLALQDEWAAMPQLIDTLIVSMGRLCETFPAVRGEHIPLLNTGCFLLDSHHRDVSAFSRVALHATFSIKLLFIPLISLLSDSLDQWPRVSRPMGERAFDECLVWEVQGRNAICDGRGTLSIGRAARLPLGGRVTRKKRGVGREKKYSHANGIRRS
ncbi:transposable element Tcb1 transposase [Trichonephila clavipes]|uniref:Transposable element Tcb1 transposase n=1 Tax=Trichonephila clavipes TaxID=2585209 RepID=A0A8X6R174_TRICX|nr:transposable element Tcb1 transposase [Trichonephila clavipes]